MPKAAVIIPARLNSSRLPRKALISLQNKALILHVAERAQEAAVGAVYIATDSEEIYSMVEQAGFSVFMTDEHCRSGTERVAEVAAKIPEDFIINLQGDEPFLEAVHIQSLARLIMHSEAPMVSLYTKFQDQAEFNDPSHVKVVCNEQNEALYFSRAAIPASKINSSDFVPLERTGKHLGIYAYRKDFLLQYTKLTATDLEQLESLEQLRALYYGYKILMQKVETKSFGIDTAEDLARAEAWMRNKE